MGLPILRTRPSYNTMLSALEGLKIRPSSWDDASPEDFDKSSHDASVNNFLMSIINNEFAWLTDLLDDGAVLSADDQRETLIQEASKRIAERCGRSAAGEMTRTWVIPESHNVPEIHFDLREPALTGDMLGLKTWGTSYVISKKLEFIGNQYLDDLINHSTGGFRVLELGAGTGLVGMAAAAIWGTDVVLTDLEEIQENLLFNVNKNQATVEALRGRISSATLDWTKPDDTLPSLHHRHFEIVIAADPMYDDEHPGLIAQMVTKFLKRDTASRALVAVPLRDDHTQLMAAAFSDSMRNSGFSVVYQGLETFKDDWKSTDEVQVQWNIWRWDENNGGAL